jgi:hypothetical protein
MKTISFFPELGKSTEAQEALIMDYESISAKGLIEFALLIYTQ